MAIPYDSVVVNIGAVHNFVANNTKSFNTNYDPRSFRIGREDLELPSMQWFEGGYENNHYLYSGIFLIGYDRNTIKFNSGTSSDFTVLRNIPGIASPFSVNFSMTDDSAGQLSQGIKTVCSVYAWPEEWRNDFIIYTYDIINQGNTYLQDVYSGLYLDFDVSSAGIFGGGAYWSDDQVNYFLGQHPTQIPESFSYMYDIDDPQIAGDDRGGYLSPKESEGYAGSRVLDSPPTKNGVPANQQSGHLRYSSVGRPRTGPDFFTEMSRELFETSPAEAGDYQYFQILGPWDLVSGDTLHIAFAIGIGPGFFGLRENLQNAYDTYWQTFKQAHLPQLLGYLPETFIVPVRTGERINLEVEAYDIDDDSLIYVWYVDGIHSTNNDSVFSYDSKNYKEGTHYISVDISDTKAKLFHEWAVIQQPPHSYYLGQNYPNPFNSGTTIPFELKEESQVTITLYNITGEEIKTLVRETIPAGSWLTKWDGQNSDGRLVASGVYFYQLKTSGYTDMKRMLLLR